MSNSTFHAESPIEVTTEKYLIKVIETGPQIIDKTSNFYVRDRRPSKSPARKNRIVKSNTLCYKFNKEEMMLDQLITSKMMKKDQFEKIIEDPTIEKLLK
jgi:hypothetical protein